MTDDPDRLLGLAVALSDGAARDWDREVDACRDTHEREVVRALGFLASVHEVHESLCARQCV